MVTPTNAIRFLRLPDVVHQSGLSRSQIYRLIGSNQFPKPVKLGQAASAWVETELNQWCIDRISAARPADAEQSSRNFV